MCHIEKTYWKGRGRMREMTFLWRRDEERVRVDGCSTAGLEVLVLVLVLISGVEAEFRPFFGTMRLMPTGSAVIVVVVDMVCYVDLFERG